MALYDSRAEDREVLTDERGSVEMYRVGTSFLVTRCKGHIGLKPVERWMARCDELVSRVGSIEVFHDWMEITSYEPEVRRRMTPWATRNRAQHRGVHIALQSRLVRMGVQVTRIATGSPLFVYPSLHELELTLTRALREANAT